MNITRKLGTMAAALALGAVPAIALAHPGNGHKPTTHPGPNAPMSSKAKAYGKFCQGEIKKHVKGQKGTPFSQCVNAMAKLASGQASNPTSACKGLSKKHVKGQKGTPYSECVSAAAKLQKTLHHGGGTTTTTTTSTDTTTT
jgi:hypothetical protein